VAHEANGLAAACASMKRIPQTPLWYPGNPIRVFPELRWYVVNPGGVLEHEYRCIESDFMLRGPFGDLQISGATGTCECFADTSSWTHPAPPPCAGLAAPCRVAGRSGLESRR
jgi:hypothetical protein